MGPVTKRMTRESALRQYRLSVGFIWAYRGLLVGYGVFIFWTIATGHGWWYLMYFGMIALFWVMSRGWVKNAQRTYRMNLETIAIREETEVYNMRTEALLEDLRMSLRGDLNSGDMRENPVDNPLDMRADGSIHKGDPAWDALMESFNSGEPVIGTQRDDGTWDVRPIKDDHDG